MNKSGQNEVSYHIINNLTESTSTQGSINQSSASNHTLAYILIPIGSIVLVALLALVAVIIFRKNRMDKLRHHLMPMYSFDPNEDGDWESELLEDQDNEQRLALRIETPSPDNAPVYKFGVKRR